MKLSLLITFYNEEKMIEKTHSAMSEQLKNMLGRELDDYELLYIDDGSKDRTFAIMKDLANSDERVRFISLSR
ncbi:MAG: glycosyltransferase, partial [Bacteroidetes bacterium]|nr:glycosyltransferase [Bacteroidota bacterium]